MLEQTRDPWFATDDDARVSAFHVGNGKVVFGGGYILVGPVSDFECELGREFRHEADAESRQVMDDVKVQLAELGGDVSEKLRTRAEFFMSEIARHDSIRPTAYPSDEDGPTEVALLWIAGGEKLLATLGETGPIYVRHVSPEGRVLLDDDLAWHEAVAAGRTILSSLSDKTRLAKGALPMHRFRNSWTRV